MSERFNPVSSDRSRTIEAGAFTLIELLVVISIVAILAALLFPAMQSVVAKARATACLAKMRSLGVAAHSFMGDNSMYLPYRSADSDWMCNLGPYLELQPPTNQLGSLPFTKVFLCPDDPSRSPRQLRTYRYVTTFKAGGTTVAAIPSKYLEFDNPSTSAMLVCVANTGNRLLDIWAFDQAIWKSTTDTSNPPDQTNDFPRPHYAGKGLNILYNDGHVAKALYPLPPETWQASKK